MATHYRNGEFPHRELDFEYWSRPWGKCRLTKDKETGELISEEEFFSQKIVVDRGLRRRKWTRTIELVVVAVLIAIRIAQAIGAN